MSSILLVTSSPRGADSVSSRVAGDLAHSIADAAGVPVTVRDLAAHPLPHIDADFAVAVKAPADTLNDRQRAILAESDAVTEELLAADTIVIAAGLINFSIPSNLKSWIDHIARAHKTFRYTAQGPEGLAKGKKVYVVVASGGVYTSGPAASFDHARPYLRSVLGFMGMTDVTFVDVEGLALGIEPVDAIVERALAAANDVVRPALAA